MWYDESPFFFGCVCNCVRDGSYYTATHKSRALRHHRVRLNSAAYFSWENTAETSNDVAHESQNGPISHFAKRLRKTVYYYYDDDDYYDSLLTVYFY